MTEWDREPLVPVTFTLYVAAEPSHESVELAEDPRKTLLGLRLQVRPELGAIVVVRTIVLE